MAAENMIVAFFSLFLIFHQLLLINGYPLVLLKTERTPECSFSALLLEGRPEDNDCNLRMLLRRRMNTPKIQIDENIDNNTRRLALDAFNRPNRRVDDVETCPAVDSICKLEGNRLCICPPQHVCEKVDDADGIYRCELLAFFTLG